MFRFSTQKWLVFFVLCSSIGKAQLSDSLFTIFKEKKSIDFSYDSRNSFIDNGLVSVQSVKGGINFGNKASVGAGYAWLQTPVYEDYQYKDEAANIYTHVRRRLYVRYACFYAEYIYYKTKRWEFSVPMQFGIGKLGYTFWYNNTNLNLNQGYCFIYEPEINVKYKVFRWIGIEGDIGYRLMVKNDPFVKKTFNSPLFSVGVFIVWNEIALNLFKKNQWVQNKFGPSDWDTH